MLLFHSKLVQLCTVWLYTSSREEYNDWEAIEFDYFRVSYLLYTYVQLLSTARVENLGFFFVLITPNAKRWSQLPAVVHKVHCDLLKVSCALYESLARILVFSS